MAQGTVEDVLRVEQSLTAQYLSGRKRIEAPRERRTPKGAIEIVGAAEHNLKNVNVKFPLGVLTAALIWFQGRVVRQTGSVPPGHWPLVGSSAWYAMPS